MRLYVPYMTPTASLLPEQNDMIMQPPHLFCGIELDHVCYAGISWQLGAMKNLERHFSETTGTKYRSKNDCHIKDFRRSQYPGNTCLVNGSSVLRNEVMVAKGEKRKREREDEEARGAGTPKSESARVKED
jgi:long-subunit fatty acid transport protein